MSLDVHLRVAKQEEGTGIFVQDGDRVRELTCVEWDEKFPQLKPICCNFEGDDDEEVYWANITHNLGAMAGAAGLYQALWRHEQIGATKASDLIEPLKHGLSVLKSDPAFFKQFNPHNGWGDYDGLVDFVEKYLAACQQYPEAEIRVSR